MNSLFVIFASSIIVIEITMFLPKGKILLSVIGFVLLALTLILLVEVVKVIFKRRKPLHAEGHM